MSAISLSLAPLISGTNISSLKMEENKKGKIDKFFYKSYSVYIIKEAYGNSHYHK